MFVEKMKLPWLQGFIIGIIALIRCRYRLNEYYAGKLTTERTHEIDIFKGHWWPWQRHPVAIFYWKPHRICQLGGA